MLSLRTARAMPLRALAARRLPAIQQRTFLPDSITGQGGVLDEKYPDYPTLTEKEDPGMNGGYINPPRVPRQFRDPYGDWWDKQERRNFGEPVHEDHDMLGVFSPHIETWVTPGKGLLQIGAFVLVLLSVVGCVKMTYPDRPSYPKEYDGGLQKELGGSGARSARAPGDADP